jgi:15-cis-phytoene synthase
MTRPALSPVLAELRGLAPEKFFACLLAPPDRRDVLAALWLMSVETARVQALADNPVIGLMRLQFWRDAIDSAADGRRLGHPAADALRQAVRDGMLPTPQFEAHFAARETILGGATADPDAPIDILARLLAGARVARLPEVAARAGKFGTRARLAMLWHWMFHRGA